MAKVEYVYIIPGLEDIYFTGIMSSDRFIYSRMARKVYFYSRKRKAGLSQRSLLPLISELWSGFSNEEKQNWSDAAACMGLSGWQLFVQDQCARIYNDIPGVATPSLLHQSWVGQLHVESPADQIKIVQIHPHFYWVSKKIKGTKNMYEPVLITEDLGLPLKIGLNYKSELIPVSTPNLAKFYARFWHSYQGQDRYTELEIPLNYSTDWVHAEATLTELIGYVIRYDVYIHLTGLNGDLYFDNVEIIHSGQNWARDPYCKDIKQGFTRAFYQIPKHWAAVILPTGAWYESVYKDF